MSITRIGPQLRRILNTDEAYEILGNSVDTWTSGGCLLLAKTLKRLCGIKAKICAIADDNAPHQHVVVKYGGFYVDADGVSNESQLLKRWQYWERLQHPRIVEFNENLVSDWLWTQDQEDMLFVMLNQQLGEIKGVL